MNKDFKHSQGLDNGELNIPKWNGSMIEDQFL